MQLRELVAVEEVWRVVPALVLGWLAFCFGRTLRSGATPLIERIARVRDPGMTPALRGYTRLLTATWTLYFVAAALLFAAVRLPPWWTSGAVWLGVIVLFVGEHQLRPHLFPGRPFPSLVQQIQDTLTIWRRAS